VAGRIAVIKSLLLPQISYILSTMPSPTKETQKEIERTLYKFLNRGGQEKIKRKILIGDYSNGGYKMIDLKSYIRAMKIRWMERLINTPGVWKKRVEQKCKIDLRYLARCNIKYKDLPFKFPKNSMWDEMWQEWCMENYKKAETMEEILNQSLWFNSDLPVNKQVVPWKKWEKEGIRWMADLMEEDCDNRLRFLNKDELEERYDIRIGQMEYISLMNSIPRNWKKRIKTHGIEKEETGEEDYKLLDKIMDNKRPMNMVYKRIVNRKKESPYNALLKWRRDMNREITDKQILKDHANNHWSVLNNKVRSFNCNFLNRNVPTNKSLTQKGLKDDENCTFCGKTENILGLHQFWECKTKKSIWKKLSELYQQTTRKFMLMNKEKCLLGTGDWIPKSEKTARLQRSLCLLTKYYLHLCKCNEDETPTKQGYENFLRNYISIEKENARQRGTMIKFKENWGRWNSWCENFQKFVD
jgi:hypothetical protein